MQKKVVVTHSVYKIVDMANRDNFDNISMIYRENATGKLFFKLKLPKSVLEVSKKMLTESSRNPMAATIEKEAGWLLLSSLLASMPKEQLEDQVFDILSLWVSLFTGNPENETNQTGDLISRIRMWSAAIDALTSFLRCFLSHDAVNNGIFLHPVLVYLSRALSYNH
ncbi:hypothetical protein M0R45_009578 [Rubus argutus]|uniref:Uncharacterized protein n=1 Tax=Rubus argutus TaxID=59490 RepID=A0AAW1Y547_RUBAR